jgi:integrase
MFETGCRVSEALALRGDMFHVAEDRVNVYGIPVLKKGRPATRNIPIRRDEVLIPYVLNRVNDYPGYLFQSPQGETYSRQWAWYRITGTDPGWWPHRLRSERATQLVVEYGFNVPKLMRFFNWSKPEEAVAYVRLDVEDLWDSMND